MNSHYVKWLQKQGVKLFAGGGAYWRLYHGALVPAPATVSFVTLSHSAAITLLNESGAMFIRYSSDPCDEPTQWWHILCDKFDPARISSKLRNSIKRGMRRCHVEQIDAQWLAAHGYACYVAAYERYKNVTASDKSIFRDIIMATLDGPFEYWGVFVDDSLAGYCQCIIEENEVSTNVIKYDPAFLRDYSSYALINSMLTHYVQNQNMILSNGTRSIAHDTKMQDFLIKFGFRKQFCRLNVVYRPILKVIIKTLYPLQKLINYLPKSDNMHKIQSLLFQEKLRKSFGHF